MEDFSDKQYRMIRAVTQSSKIKIRIPFARIPIKGIIAGLNNKADEEICATIDKYCNGQDISKDVEKMIKDKKNYIIGYDS